jgi:hypothetical protein
LLFFRANNAMLSHTSEECDMTVSSPSQLDTSSATSKMKLRNEKLLKRNYSMSRQFHLSNSREIPL